MPLIHQPGVGRSEAARTGSNLRPSMPGARTSLSGDEVPHGLVRAHLSRQANTRAGPRFSAYSYNLLVSGDGQRQTPVSAGSLSCQATSGRGNRTSLAGPHKSMDGRRSCDPTDPLCKRFHISPGTRVSQGGIPDPWVRDLPDSQEECNVQG